MPSLIGSFPFNVDSKSRINIPADLRRELPGTGSFVLIPGLDKCIFVFSEEEWDRIDQHLKSQALPRKDERLMQRAIYSNAARKRCDDQGRIAIPPKLLEYAGITREALVVGVSNRIEIWNPTAYNEYIESLQSYEDLVENLMNGTRTPGNSSSQDTSQPSK
jgi:MraZ protein